MHSSPQMKKMNLILCGFVALSLFLQCNAAAFKSDSILLYGSQSGVAAIFEFDISGTYVQTITFPGYYYATKGLVSGDGSILAVAMKQSLNTDDKLCVSVNTNGEFVDATKLVNPEFNDCHINGTDVWMNTYRAISYAKRGSVSDIITANILNPPNPLYARSTQLVGDKFFALAGDIGTFGLYVQDPVMTTTLGGATLISGHQDKTAFLIHNQNILYAYTPSKFFKYTLVGTTTTLAYSFSLTGIAGSETFSLAAIEADGVTYVFVTISISLASKVIRVTDDGTAFSGQTVLSSTQLNSVAFNHISTTPKPSCSDTLKNQDETDIDCGGSTCSTCADGKSCLVDGDCTNDYCNPNNKCATPTCADMYKNQNETDVDCGGLCSTCADGKSCLVNGDCTNDFCDPNNKCATPTCSDSIKNQGETDVDCGGSKCSACVIGKSCLINSDCAGNKCSSNVCAASCIDNILNQDETDVDCGGSCPACVDGQKCQQQADCETDYCNPNSICSVPACNDGWKNEDETDVDCGGQTCIKCNVGSACLVDSDCSSNTCSSNLCTVPPPTPVDTPVNDQSPQSESPVSSQPSSVNSPSSTSSPSTSKTPVSKKVSSGVVVEAAVLGLGGIVVINLM